MICYTLKVHHWMMFWEFTASTNSSIPSGLTLYHFHNSTWTAPPRLDYDHDALSSHTGEIAQKYCPTKAIFHVWNG